MLFTSSRSESHLSVRRVVRPCTWGAMRCRQGRTLVTRVSMSGVLTRESEFAPVQSGHPDRPPGLEWLTELLTIEPSARCSKITDPTFRKVRTAEPGREPQNFMPLRRQRSPPLRAQLVSRKSVTAPKKPHSRVRNQNCGTPRASVVANVEHGSLLR